jgi:short-subunit dehydrogenase
MKLRSSRVVVTGAGGGIGQALARALAERGAQLGLVDLRQEPLDALADELSRQSVEAIAIPADLAQKQDRQQVVRRMQETFGGIDVLINNAGVMDFSEFADEDPELIERTVKVNVLAPMQLTRAVLPDMLARQEGRIVNIGSIFGSIGFACFASYSASKFALRGFSEALRREVAGSGVGITYVAPRAVKTALNSSAVYRMAAKVKMNMDEPASVARRIVRAIEKRKEDVYLGFPESLFVRVNAILPRVVNGALRKQNTIMREFTHEV